MRARNESVCSVTRRITSITLVRFNGPCKMTEFLGGTPMGERGM